MARTISSSELPQPAESFACIHDAALAPVLKTLAALHAAPPRTLLLEGGNGMQRLEAAKYWAALANCGEMAGNRSNVPCLECDICRQIGGNQFTDLLVYDGRIGNAEDEDNPGPIKALNMRRIRELKSILFTEPHGAGKRIVILQGLPLNRDNAANALLKVLEEPPASTLFVLLAAQREHLLPTLVSRSFVLTLPWEDPSVCAFFPLQDEVVQFLATGKNLLDKISGRGVLDLETARQIILGCQKTLMRVLDGKIETPLEKLFARATDARTAAIISRWFAEAGQMLQYMVNPARVIEGLFTRLFCILH